MFIFHLYRPNDLRIDFFYFPHTIGNILPDNLLPGGAFFGWSSVAREIENHLTQPINRGRYCRIPVVNFLLSSQLFFF